MTNMVEKSAEQTQGMKNVKRKMIIYNSLQTDWDEYLPWREYVDYQSVLESWDDMWQNPEQYAEEGMGEPESKEEQIFRMGVAFGIEFERAYPSGEEDEWPVDLEDR